MTISNVVMANTQMQPKTMNTSSLAFDVELNLEIECDF